MENNKNSQIILPIYLINTINDDSNCDIRYILELNNKNKEEYILSIKINKKGNELIFKFEKKELHIYYYYAAYDFLELKKMNKVFNRFQKIENVFELLKKNNFKKKYEFQLNQYNLCFNLYDINNKDKIFCSFNLRKKIMNQTKINLLIINQLTKQENDIQKINTQITSLKNEIGNLEQNLIEKQAQIEKLIKKSNSDNIDEKQIKNNTVNYNKKQKEHKKDDNYCHDKIYNYFIFPIVIFLFSFIFYKVFQVQRCINNIKDAFQNENEYKDADIDANIDTGLDIGDEYNYPKIGISGNINFRINSNIIDSNVDLSFLIKKLKSEINNWNKINFKDIYRASRDGDSSNIFNEKCNNSINNNNPIIILIRTRENKHIFGAFTSNINKDENVFYFSLDNGKIYNNIKENKIVPISLKNNKNKRTLLKFDAFTIYDHFLTEGGYCNHKKGICEIIEEKKLFSVKELEVFRIFFE